MTSFKPPTEQLESDIVGDIEEGLEDVIWLLATKAVPTNKGAIPIAPVREAERRLRLIHAELIRARRGY